MSKPITGKITTSTWNQKRSNGDIYVWERKTQYVPETRKTKEISRRLLGKIPAGSTDGKMVPTRPKRKKQQSPAALKRIGITQLLSWIGKESGISEDLLKCTDIDTAEKIETLAQFWLFKHEELSYPIEKWQILHPTPYKKPISYDVCSDLFTQLGKNKEVAQNYFKARADKCNVNGPLVFEFCNDAPNPELNGEDTTFRMLLDPHSYQPFAYAREIKHADKLPNIKKAFKEISFLGNFKAEELITDSIFHSKEILPKLVRGRRRFLTRAYLSFPWVHKTFQENRKKIEKALRLCPWNNNFQGCSIPIKSFSTL